MLQYKLSSCKNNYTKLFIIIVQEKEAGNILYFVEHAMIYGIDYLFIINGDISFIEKFTNLNYIKISNINNDFSAYSYGLEYVAPKIYDYYFFMNSSTRGSIYTFLL